MPYLLIVSSCLFVNAPRRLNMQPIYSQIVNKRWQAMVKQRVPVKHTKPDDGRLFKNQTELTIATSVPSCVNKAVEYIIV